jgi:hypothetical protein
LVVLLTAFTLSAMRLYFIGAETFQDTIDQPYLSIVAGIAIVLLSEAATVLFTIALSVIGKSQTQRRILLLSVCGTAALALSGNYYVALHDHTLTVFSILEAMLPPLLTLSTAYVLKELLLDVIAQRHADQQAYLSALMEWERATARPEDDPKFIQLYANELRDALQRVNRRRKAAWEAIQQFDSVAWRWLIRRELQADDWYVERDDGPPASPSGLAEEVAVKSESPLVLSLSAGSEA